MNAFWYIKNALCMKKFTMKELFATLLLLSSASLWNGQANAAVVSILDNPYLPGSSGTGYAGGIGQSYTISSGSWTNIFLNIYTPSGASIASGAMYMLNQEYLGTPSGLSSSTPGFLAAANAAFNTFSFPTLSLASGTRYWFYANTRINGSSGLGGTAQNTATGGYFYNSSNGTGNFTKTANTNNLAFLMQGISTTTALIFEPIHITDPDFPVPLNPLSAINYLNQTSNPDSGIGHIFTVADETGPLFEKIFVPDDAPYNSYELLAPKSNSCSNYPDDFEEGDIVPVLGYFTFPNPLACFFLKGIGVRNTLDPAKTFVPTVKFDRTGFVSVTQTTSLAPAPAPLSAIGMATAYGWTRRLRLRVKSS
jgi:hypothetical protein